VFSEAYEIASNFTFPVVVSTRYFDKTVNCINGAFVVLNNEGWIMTVAHIVQAHIQYNHDKKALDAYKNQLASITNDPSLSDKLKRRQKNQLHKNQKWITNFSFWWGKDGVSLERLIVNPFADLAVGKLSPFDPTEIKKYPTIKNPANLKIATSLCKLGFPFHKIQATFDETTENFTLSPGSLPIPRFPIEGIYTRNSVFIDQNDNTKKTKFIETSSPGLRGQSGGPIFDTAGNIWAIQSKTSHIPLGFNPTIKKGSQLVEENQFLNVGLGVHPEVIVSFLTDNHIAFQLSEH